MNRTLALLVAAATLLAVGCCCCCGGLDWIERWSDWDWEAFPTLVFETPVSPVFETLTPEVTPVITREPVGDVGAETERLLETTEVPVRDLHDLAVRLRGLPPDTPRTVDSGGSPDYAVGTRRLFRASLHVQKKRAVQGLADEGDSGSPGGF